MNGGGFPGDAEQLMGDIALYHAGVNRTAGGEKGGQRSKRAGRGRCPESTAVWR